MAHALTPVRVRTVDSPRELEVCFHIRRVVFIQGQNVPEDEEMDGRDGECTHFLAETIASPGPVFGGTARLRITEEGAAKLERLAVLQHARGRGLGTMLVRAVEAEAVRRGHAEVILGAQLASLAFYESCGYRAEGPVFDDAGIPHRLMRRRLGD